MSITDEKYVSLTTKKRNGETVSSPVWIATLPDGTIGFTTDDGSGKVKRIRNFPDVTLQPCDSRGRIKEGSTIVNATATILTGEDVASVEQAVRDKYGLMVPLIGIGYKIRGLFSREPAAERAAIRLSLD